MTKRRIVATENRKFAKRFAFDVSAYFYYPSRRKVQPLKNNGGRLLKKEGELQVNTVEDPTTRANEELSMRLVGARREGTR